MSSLSRKQQTQKRHRRLRRLLAGTPERPRLAVFRSNNHIYAQVIDDEAQSTLCSASTLDKDLRTAVEAGFMTRNEAREELDLDPLPGLDAPIQALNMGTGGGQTNIGTDTSAGSSNDFTA